MRKVILVLGLHFVTFGAFSQQSDDYGIFLGAIFKHQHSILPLPVSKQIAPAGGLFYRYNMNARYAIRGGLNLAFTGRPVPDMDAHGLLEFNFHPLNPKKEKANISSFIATGISYIYDSEVNNYANALIVSDPEYQISDYLIRNVSIPFNIGVRYNPTKKTTFTVEWALRKTFQRNWQHPANRQISNWQSFIGATFGYKIIRTCNTCPFYESNRKKRR